MTDYVVAIELSWAAWYASWMIAAAFTAATVKRARSTIVVYLLEVPGFFLLLATSAKGAPVAPVWQPSALMGWGFFVLNLPGFGFAWWARLSLGRLWSGTITRKQDHYLVDTGPYRLVRHPIYTGLMASVVMTVAAKGTMLALFGGVLLMVGWTIKARFEERFLAKELGAARYQSYRARVPMFLPLGSKNGTVP